MLCNPFISDRRPGTEDQFPCKQIIRIKCDYILQNMSHGDIVSFSTDRLKKAALVHCVSYNLLIPSRWSGPPTPTDRNKLIVMEMCFLDLFKFPFALLFQSDFWLHN